MLIFMIILLFIAPGNERRIICCDRPWREQGNYFSANLFRSIQTSIHQWRVLIYIQRLVGRSAGRAVLRTHNAHTMDSKTFIVWWKSERETLPSKTGNSFQPERQHHNYCQLSAIKIPSTIRFIIASAKCIKIKSIATRGKHMLPACSARGCFLFLKTKGAQHREARQRAR